MYKFTNSVAITISLLSFAFVLPLLTALPAIGQTSGKTTTTTSSPTQTVSVNVVNTPNVSVTNTPNVNIANTPSVSLSGTPTVNLATGTSVGISGTPNVAISGTPSVNIANNLISVRDVDNPSRHPFQTQSGPLYFNDSPGVSFNVTVPANKRLVIEQVSVIATLVFSASQKALVSVSTQDSFLYFAPQDIGNAFGSVGFHQFLVTSLQMHVYSSSGVTIDVLRWDSSGGGFDSAQISLSGYLVDMP